MCGRYQAWVDDDDLVRVIEREKKGMAEEYFRRQEVFPGTEMPVLYGAYSTVRAHVSRWGFELPEDTPNGKAEERDSQSERKKKSPRLLINARAETAAEKPLFRDSVKFGRSVVLADGYYEWASRSGLSCGKQKYFFTPSRNEPVLLMAALETVNLEEKADFRRRYVILTTEAQGAVTSVHDRMPLLLHKDELRLWLYDEEFALFRMQNPRSWDLSLCAAG